MDNLYTHGLKKKIEDMAKKNLAKKITKMILSGPGGKRKSAGVGNGRQGNYNKKVKSS